MKSFIADARRKGNGNRSWHQRPAPAAVFAVVRKEEGDEPESGPLATPPRSRIPVIISEKVRDNEGVIAGARGACARQSPRLLDRVREVMRFRHYSLRTEEAYTGWIRRFILFHGKRHPLSLGTEEVRSFLTDLAVNGQVAAPTQNQALSALLFLYQQVLQREIGWLNDVPRAQRPGKMPVVCTAEEVRLLLSAIKGNPARLMAHLLYGSGLRLMARKSFAHVPGSARNTMCSMSMC